MIINRVCGGPVFVLAVTAVAACEWRVESHHDRSDPLGAAPPDQGEGSGSGSASGDPGGAACTAVIDRRKELLVTNRSVLGDRRARNDVAGAPWSFRSRLEELAGTSAGSSVSAFAAAWLEQWATVTSVGPDAAPVEARPRVRAILEDPWRAAGDGYTLPLDRAPFRLLAIVNRLDLRDGECAADTGELRFVYAALDAKGVAIAMTVIVEIPYPAGVASDEWARRWHALGKLGFGAQYNDALEAITTAVTSRAPRETIRVRTDEAALSSTGQDWELRELGLDAAKEKLVVVPLAQTPRIDLLRSASLDAWAADNGTAIAHGTFVLPGAFEAGSAPVDFSSFRWESSRMTPETRHAFSLATCNGCHGGERGPDSLPFQHIAAPEAAYYGRSDGETQVSRYLDNGSGRDDELARRAGSLVMALCRSCTAAAPSPGNKGGYSPSPSPSGSTDAGAPAPAPLACPPARRF